MKRNPWLLLISAALAACFALRAPAQATPPAYEGAGGIRVGFAYSNADPDEETKRIGGFSVYGIYGVLPHFSLEADVHLLQFFTPEDFAESSYLVGGRVYYRKQRYEPYLKFLGGVVRTTTQANGVSVAGAPDAYGAFAVAAGWTSMSPTSS